MDVGKHFEFHCDNTTGSDYSTVLSCTGNYSNIVNLPSKSGTLALLTDNVASASKWANARTITLTGSVTGSVSIDGSSNVTLSTTTNHTHTFASLTDKPTTISGYGITDGLRQVTLADNVENDFNTFENLTLTGRGDPTTGSSLLNSPWTKQPAGGFGVLTYLWSVYGLQLAAGYSSNDLYIRNKYYTGGGSNWDTRWDKILNSSNFNSYAPSLTGVGASGTWDISISGNAGSANALNLEAIGDLNSVTDNRAFYSYFKALNRPLSNYATGILLKHPDLGYKYQLVFDTNGGLFTRHYTSSWKPWKTIAFTDSDITGNAATASNASAVNGVSFTWDGEITSSQ